MIKVGIICGCLPRQAGIEQSELYHQLMAGNIFRETGEQLSISSIWYTNLTKSINKVLELIEKENPEIILYHIRPDPYLRISKLFIRYRDRFNKHHLILNLNADDKNIDERYYSPRNSLPLPETSWKKIIFRDFNYLLGLSLGVNNRAISREKNLLKELAAVCSKHQKELIIIGPASRPRSKMENYLLKSLEIKLALDFKNDLNYYITCFGTQGNENENIFKKDGVHVSKAGHRRIAELIEPTLLKLIHEQVL